MSGEALVIDVESKVAELRAQARRMYIQGTMTAGDFLEVEMSLRSLEQEVRVDQENRN